MLMMRQAREIKAAIGRAIKSGEFSAHKKAIDGCDGDPAGLFTANTASARTISGNSSTKRYAKPAIAPTETAILMARLDAEIDWVNAQKKQVKKMRKKLVEMKVQSEKWQDEAQSAQRLLTDVKPHWSGWSGLGKAS